MFVGGAWGRFAALCAGFAALAFCADPHLTIYNQNLYTLAQPATIHDRETKQVEFLRASGIQSKRLYVYDGMLPDQLYGQDPRQAQQYGTRSNPHVWAMREFSNSDANHLGVPLPKGRMRF